MSALGVAQRNRKGCAPDSGLYRVETSYKLGTAGTDSPQLRPALSIVLCGALFCGRDMAVSFLCSLAPLQSAIQITGDGNGMRIKLDIPQSEMAAAVHLLTMTSQVLRVTVELASAKQMQTDGESMETRPKRQPRWTASEESSTNRAVGESG
jgi:hypothetical protein